MNESDGEERGVIESPLYVHWADKQVAEYIMRMNEEEGTLSPPVYLHLLHTPPLSVSLSGQSEVEAPYLEVDVSLCFFWQRFQAAQLAKRWELQGQGEWSVF